MVIITLKTILKEKVGYHFCQVILLFWLQQKVLPCKKFFKNDEHFLSEALTTPGKKANNPHGVAIPS